ncbi:hypothetical protein A2U01_0024346, partial [Trifolium medium]|nr:hypothetical protein [Trifolium medium]
ITHAVPINTVSPQSSKKKRTRSTVKKEKRSKVSESVPSPVSIKNPKSKGKKSKSTAGPRKALTMSELYHTENPFESSNEDPKVDTSVNVSVIGNVETSAKACETLGVENPKSTENLGIYDLGRSDGDDVNDGAPTKAISDSDLKPLKETVPETDVVADVDTSVVHENVQDQTIPETPEKEAVPEKEKSPDNLVAGNIFGNTVVNSQSDESMKTVSANIEDSVSIDKNVETETNFVDVDDLTSGERSTEKNPAPSIAKRLRSNSGKVVATASEPDKTPKKGKKTSTSVKPVHYALRNNGVK